MFTHMSFVKKDCHNVRNTNYELLVYQVEETNEYRIYVSKDGFGGVGSIFTTSKEFVQDAQNQSKTDLVAELISIAKNDIDKNEFGNY